MMAIGLLCFSCPAPGEDETPVSGPVAVPIPSPSPSSAEVITMSFKSIVADDDYEPEDGEIYEITLQGDDKKNLKFSYKRLQPFSGDVRIFVQTLNTPSNRFLLDSKNQGLFKEEEGEFTLELIVPAGWPVFLAEFAEGPWGNPVPLSNVVREWGAGSGE